MGVSVIICCYNSSGRLPETLSHLAGQKFSTPVNWEVVLVDNASVDDTANIAIECWNAYGTPVPLKMITESKQGLSYAREAGIKNAANDIIVFCDDDNWLAQDYLQNAYAIMMADEKIGICGGVGEAVFEGAQPGWFDRYKLVFACGEQAMYEGELGIDHMALYGAGMVVRKEIYDMLDRNNYEFNLTGRKGNKIIAGEDYELAILARALGYKLYYAARLRFKHYMPAQRMQWQYLIKTIYGSALSSAPIFIYADVLRYKLSGNKKYNVSRAKDILKAINSARLMSITELKDLQAIWARLSGGVYSVLANLSNYEKLKDKIERIYRIAHNTD